VTMAICARKRIPFVPSFILAELTGHAAAKAWQAAEDVHSLAAWAHGEEDLVARLGTTPGPEDTLPPVPRPRS